VGRRNVVPTPVIRVPEAANWGVKINILKENLDFLHTTNFKLFNQIK
jgi:hypothetical protein